MKKAYNNPLTDCMEVALKSMICEGTTPPGTEDPEYFDSPARKLYV